MISKTDEDQRETTALKIAYRPTRRAAPRLLKGAKIVGRLGLMTATYEFTSAEIETAFDRAGSACECCGKALTWSNSRSRGGGRGQWEAHHGSRFTPVILCCGGVENCHLNCGHDGHYGNSGITPRVHKGG